MTYDSTALYVVYGLYTTDDTGKRHYFYVGRTRRSVNVRVREHVQHAARSDVDLAIYLRYLKQQDTSWNHDLLREVRRDEYQQDAERWEVIRLLRLGHDLRNMRYGDATYRAELARQTEDAARIRSLADVTAARTASERMAALRKTVKTRGRLRRKELERMLKSEGLADAGQCMLLGPGLRRRLVGYRIRRSETLQALIAAARTQPEFERMVAKLRVAASV